MALLVANSRTRRRTLGDDGDGGGFTSPPGTVSVPDLQQQNQAGAFNTLTTPGTGPGSDIESPLYPLTYQGMNNGWNNIHYTAEGPYFMPNLSAEIAKGEAEEAAGTGGTPAVTAVATDSGILADIEALFSSPIYSGSPITWGWAFLGAAALFLVMRKS